MPYIVVLWLQCPSVGPVDGDCGIRSADTHHERDPRQVRLNGHRLYLRLALDLGLDDWAGCLHAAEDDQDVVIDSDEVIGPAYRVEAAFCCLNQFAPQGHVGCAYLRVSVGGLVGEQDDEETHAVAGVLPSDAPQFLDDRLPLSLSGVVIPFWLAVGQQDYHRLMAVVGLSEQRVTCQCEGRDRVRPIHPLRAGEKRRYLGPARLIRQWGEGHDELRLAAEKDHAQTVGNRAAIYAQIIDEHLGGLNAP